MYGQMSLWGGLFVACSTFHTFARLSSKPDKKFMAITARRPNLASSSILVIPSGSLIFNKQIFIARFSSKTLPLKLNPWFVTGFSDAESSFQINIRKRPENLVGWRVSARFEIYLDEKDLALLNLIKSYFGKSGSILRDIKRNKASFSMNKFDDFIKFLIPHFVAAHA